MGTLKASEADSDMRVDREVVFYRTCSLGKLVRSRGNRTIRWRESNKGLSSGNVTWRVAPAWSYRSSEV